MTEVSLLMMELIRSEIFGSEVKEEYRKPISAEMGRALYTLSKAHDLSHVIASALEKTPIIEDAELIEKFKKSMHLAVYRYRMQNAEYNDLSEVLEAAEIDYLPLKGSVIRSLYPTPWMRTSSDIDVLVRREDLTRAETILMTELEYERDSRSSHDVVLVAPSGVHVELHFDLVEDARLPSAAAILRSIFERAEPERKGLHRYVMRDEDFYFYHIAHMAKHFDNGGCGIRPFIDLMLIGEQNTEKRKELLSYGELLRFAESSLLLSEYWFCGADGSETIEAFSSFVLSGGTYGTTKNSVAVKGSRKGKFGYIMSRLFLPFSTLKERYPILNKHPYLAPAMQVKRWFGMIKGKRLGKSFGELKENASLSNDTVERTADMLRNIGL